MRYLIILIFLMFGCSKPQSKLICGDYECINNLEAKQYFKENLTLEVRVYDKENKMKSYDLVQYNLDKGDKNKKKVKIFKKKEKKENLRILSKNEKLEKLKEIRIKKNQEEQTKKIVKLQIENKVKKDKIKKNNIGINKDTEKDITNIKKNSNLNDICELIENCDIDQITDYLIKLGNKKKFPDISKKSR